MKKLTINYKQIYKYICFLLLFVLLSNAKTFSGFKPFSLGLFVALTYAKQNLLVVSLMYILSNIAFSPTIQTAVTTVVPCIMIFGAYFLHDKLKYPINMIYINIYALLSSLVPLAYITTDMLLDAFVSILLGAIFTYSMVILCNAVLIRGLKYRLNSDEIMAGGVFFVVLGLSLYSAQINGFNFYFLVSPFIILLSSYFSSSVTLGLSILLGLGVTLSTGDLIFCATTSLWGLSVSIFKKIPYISSISLVLIDLLLGMYFKAYNSYGIYNIIGVCLGSFSFIILPKKIRRFLTSNFAINSGGLATKNIVNRSRKDVSNKLAFISNVFYDMNAILSSSYKKERSLEEKSKVISHEFTGRMCKNCRKRQECEKILGGETCEIYEKMIYSCLKRGKATILDIPPFVASRCASPNEIIRLINKELDFYDKKVENERLQNQTTKALASQMESMSSMLKEISQDINKTVKFDQNTEQKIIDELLLHNVVCFEAMVYQTGQKIEVSLVVREVDVNKKIITKVISKLVKKKMIIKMNSIKKVKNSCCLELIEQPNFDVVFGLNGVNRNEELVSGDSRFVKRISDDKIIVALSDGMGSGEKANEKSLATLSMIESFYKAGFQNEIILSMVNKLLTLTCDEDYATIDMCIIDLITGSADFIKMGASDGLIRRKEDYEVISSSTLPIGIIENVNINVESKQLVSGDMVIVVSDGVTDVLSDENIMDIVDSAKTNNPQSIAELISNKAINKGATDDVSTIVARLFNKVA